MSFNHTHVRAIKKMDESGFSPSLMRLITRADHINREKLRGAFPEYVEAFEAWQASPSEDDFFDEHLGAKPNKGDNDERKET